LLHWVLAQAELAWDVIDYDSPAPLSTLWARADLGVAMMCGLPFSQRKPRPALVAAPIPSPARYGGKPAYFTDFVVRSDSPYRTLEDTFGGTIGYTLADSMSGGVAMAHHLAPLRQARGQRLYKRAVGDLIHARGVIDALAQRRIDAGPLDSYYHDLLRHNDPAFAARVRTVATTRAWPIPPLVATAALAATELERLRQALSASSQAQELAPVMERLLLAGFAFPDAADYDVLAAVAQGPLPAFEEL
jgi:ABC-type phosphate/phosphonate transport system substrate-binding protein